jgi:O-antigen/teichoic acid export membrane protein
MLARVVAVGGGRAALVGLWFGATVLLIRTLGPAEFGQYALAVAFIKILSGIVGDSLDLAVLRQVPVHLVTDPARAFAVVRGAFTVRVGVGVAVLAGGAVAAASAADVFFKSAGASSLVVFAAAGVLGELLLRSATGFFQAGERFRRYMQLEGALHVTRVTIVVALAASDALSATTALATYVGVPYLVFAAGVRFLPRELVRRPFGHRADAVGVLDYSRWIALAMGLAAVYERVDIVLLGYFRAPEEVGVYSAALALATIPDFVVGCLATVLHPRVMPAYVNAEFGRLRRQYLRWAVPVAAVAVIGVFAVGGWLVQALLTARYVEAVPVFEYLAVGVLFGAVVTPLPSALLAMVAPLQTVAVTALGLGVTLTAGMLVIPAFGAPGAALMFVATRLLLGATVAYLGLRVERATGGDARGEPPLRPVFSARAPGSVE